MTMTQDEQKELTEYFGRMAKIVDFSDTLDEADALLRRLVKFNEELCADVGVSVHYPSAKDARAYLARREGK